MNSGDLSLGLGVALSVGAAIHYMGSYLNR